MWKRLMTKRNENCVIHWVCSNSYSASRFINMALSFNSSSSYSVKSHWPVTKFLEKMHVLCYNSCGHDLSARHRIKYFKDLDSGLHSKLWIGSVTPTSQRGKLMLMWLSMATDPNSHLGITLIFIAFWSVFEAYSAGNEGRNTVSHDRP